MQEYFCYMMAFGFKDERGNPSTGPEPHAGGRHKATCIPFISVPGAYTSYILETQGTAFKPFHLMQT